MRESDIEKKCSQLSKNAGFITYKFVSPNNKAVPDRIFIKGGNVLFVEFKQKGKEPTKLQYKVISEMCLAGAKVFVIEDIASFKNLISYYN
jgi:Holliday junction resolvase